MHQQAFITISKHPATNNQISHLPSQLHITTHGFTLPQSFLTNPLRNHNHHNVPTNPAAITKQHLTSIKPNHDLIPSSSSRFHKPTALTQITMADSQPVAKNTSNPINQNPTGSLNYQSANFTSPTNTHHQFHFFPAIPIIFQPANFQSIPCLNNHTAALPPSRH